MIAIYFSSTGNTKHCTQKFIERLGGDIPAVSIEDEACVELLKLHDDVILAYPVYFSDLPQIVREFICENSASLFAKTARIFAVKTSSSSLRWRFLAATELAARLGY